MKPYIKTSKKVIDHINGNTLDNRKKNLRVVSIRTNTNNRHVEQSSNYPGVHYDKERDKWRAGIIINGERVELKRHETELEAKEAYEMALKKYNCS